METRDSSNEINLINDLKKRFVNLNYSDNLKKMRALVRDCIKYLSHYEDNEYNQVQNTIHVLKAAVDYNLKDNRTSAFGFAKPMFKDLEFGNEMSLLKDNYNKLLLTYGIAFCRDYKLAQSVLENLEKSFEFYNVEEKVKNDTQKWAYINFCEILTHTKIYEKLPEEKLAEVKSLFRKYDDKARDILIDEGTDKLLLSILFIKEQQFYTGKPERKKAIKQEFSVAELINKTEEAAEIKVDDFPVIIKNIGLIMAREREARKISQEQLAEILGFTLEYISLMENGKRNITLKTVIIICKLFKLSVDELIVLNP